MQALVFLKKQQNHKAQKSLAVPLITCDVGKSSRTFEVGEVRGICDEQTNSCCSKTKYLQ